MHFVDIFREVACFKKKFKKKRNKERKTSVNVVAVYCLSMQNVEN